MGHGFSWKCYSMSFLHFLISNRRPVWSKLTLNSLTIPSHLYRFYLFFMLEHDKNFGQGQVMEFPWHLPRKWWYFHQILSHFRTKPNSRQKDMNNPVSHFVQGCYVNVCIYITFFIPYYYPFFYILHSMNWISRVLYPWEVQDVGISLVYSGLV